MTDDVMKMFSSLLKDGLFTSGLVGRSCLLITGLGPPYEHTAPHLVVRPTLLALPSSLL
jgi:hypothetical protein